MQMLAVQAPCIVAMEACATSHYWGRVAQSHGHDVRLIPPIYVKPFVKRQKNDAANCSVSRLAVATLDSMPLHFRIQVAAGHPQVPRGLRLVSCAGQRISYFRSFHPAKQRA